MKTVGTFVVVLAFLSTGCLGDEPETASTGGASGGGGAAGSASGGVGGTAGTCSPPEGGTCDAFHQCGCAGGQNCLYSLGGSGSTVCRPDGPTQAYQMCAAFDACQNGMMCVKGICEPFCEKPSDCPGPRRICQQLLVSGSEVPGALTCTAGCELISPSSICGPGVTCVPLASGSQGTQCVAGAGSGVGPGTCTSYINCKPGYTCVDPGGYCLKWCRVGYPDCGAQQCVGFQQPNKVYVDGFEYGTC